jgi:hypothetical protein
MLRRPFNPTFLVVGLIVALLLVYQWVYKPVWLHTGAGSGEDASIGPNQGARQHAQDIYNNTLGVSGMRLRNPVSYLRAY